MSAFAVIYDRSGAPLEPGALGPVMERLAHSGPDGQDTLVSGSLAMGHWHFWTTPEEVGERQPLRLHNLPFSLVFDGRLDNREDLFDRLSISTDEGRLLSDAALVLRAYVAWGKRCLEHFIGEYALVLYDEQSQTLFSARDRLGDRALFYSLYGNCLVIASEPWAVLGASKKPPEADEYTAASFFAGRASPRGRTFFKGVTELLPAHFMVFGAANTLSLSRYWEPDLTRRLRYKSDAEYAEHFRSLLEESVRCRLRSVTQAGISMSGGLDSTSVASLAARIIGPKQLTTFSYVFDELLDCDEQVYIDAVQEKYNTLSIKIPADDTWPFQGLGNLHLDPNQPDRSPFALLVSRLYGRINQEGIRTLLTGEFGDHMFQGGVDWLADLLAEGKLRDAGQELLFHRPLGIQKIIGMGFLQRVARRLLNGIPGGRNLHRRQSWPSWLTAASIGYLSDLESQSYHYNRHDVMLSSLPAQQILFWANAAKRHKIDLRHPFRDQRLVEFILTVPAYHLCRGPVTKHLLRQAMEGVLPDVIQRRKDKATINELYFRGLEREGNEIARRLQASGKAWQQFVHAEQLSNVAQIRDDVTRGIVWLCNAYQLWHNSFIEFGGSHD